MIRFNRSLMSSFGIVILGIAAVVPVEAHEPYRREVTVYPGTSSSVITKNERKKIAKQRQRVGKLHRRAMRDGHVTRKEAKKIKKAQDKLERRRARAMDTGVNRAYGRGMDDWRGPWTRNRRIYDHDTWDYRQRYRRPEYGWYGNRGRRGRDGTDYHLGWHDHRDHRYWNDRRERDR